MPHITSLNKRARYAQWLDVYAERLLPGDYTALMLAHCPPDQGYEFDAEEAARLKDKPLVVFDMREYGWERSWRNLDILGSYSDEPEYSGDQWKKLNEWAGIEVGIHEIYFKRELSFDLLNSPSGTLYNLYPIDLLSRNRPWFEPQSKDEFMARKGGVYHLFGYSHEDRRLLKSALDVLPKYWHGFNPCAYAEEIHHTNRKPLMQVIMEQMAYVLSVALPGAGWSTFRRVESCVGCIPVVDSTPMVSAIPFTDENAIMLPTVDGRIDISKSIDTILLALQDHEALWPKYLAAQEVARQYSEDYYMTNFVNNRIKEIL